nr:hypothetical protein [Tanacetum cinerariifolium]
MQVLLIKKVNDVRRLQALIDRKKVIITEATIREALRLDDVESIDCSPNEKIFTKLSRMGAQVGDLSSHTTKYSSPALTQKVFANMRRVGKGFSGVETPLFEGMIVAQHADDVANKVAADVDVDDVPTADAEPTLPSPTPTTQPPPPPPQELPSISQVTPTPPPSLIAQPSSPPQQQQPSQPTHDAEISMDLLHTLLETYTTLTRRIEHLKQDKIAQALEITKLKRRVRKLEGKNKVKVYGLRRLKKVETTQRVESSADTVMDDQEDASKQGEIIANIDADDDVTLKDVVDDKVEENADVQGRPEESQAQIYKIDLEHADNVLSIQDDELEPIKKGIMVQEPKPLKKQAQIEHDEAYARELEAELNKNINWDDVIEQTEAQARKNMMIYLRNMAGFKMDYFKEMSYDDIRPIFEKYFNSNVAFLEKTKDQLEEEERRALKRTSESLEEKAAKKQNLDEEVEELKKHLQIVPNDDDDVYTELFLSFLSLLRNFDREDLEVLWQIVKKRFASSKPKNFSDDFMLTTLTYMFEKPDVQAPVWKNQRSVHVLANVKSWRLLEYCGVHIITFITTQMILLVERRYPLTMFTLDQMLNNVRLEVEEKSEVSLESLRFVRQQHQEGFRPE